MMTWDVPESLVRTVRKRGNVPNFDSTSHRRAGGLATILGSQTERGRREGTEQAPPPVSALLEDWVALGCRAIFGDVFDLISAQNRLS